MGRKTLSMGTPLFLKFIIIHRLSQRKGKIAKNYPLKKGIFCRITS